MQQGHFGLSSYTFIICWTPAQVEYLIDNFENENENCFVDCESILNAVVTDILLLNMVVNPFIYAISLKEFQENFKRTMSLLKCSLASVSCCKLLIFSCRHTSVSLQQHDANTAGNNHGDVSLVHHHKRGEAADRFTNLKTGHDNVVQERTMYTQT